MYTTWLRQKRAVPPHAPGRRGERLRATAGATAAVGDNAGVEAGWVEAVEDYLTEISLEGWFIIPYNPI